MKRFITLIFLVGWFSLTSQSASGADPKVFNGGYAITKKGCGTMYEAGYRRAYISVGMDALKAADIRIRFFGDDAQEDSILLGRGSRKPLGVARGQSVTETWETVFESDTHLVSKKTTKGPLSEFVETSELTLAKKQTDVEYKLTSTVPGTPKQNVCRLQPKLREEEEVSLCQQIRIWGQGANNEEVAKMSVKNCRNNGVFDVSGNDAGQLEVTYTNVTVRDDESLVCTAAFDKPMGEFAPAVESCDFN